MTAGAIFVLKGREIVQPLYLAPSGLYLPCIRNPGLRRHGEQKALAVSPPPWAGIYRPFGAWSGVTLHLYFSICISYESLPLGLTQPRISNAIALT